MSDDESVFSINTELIDVFSGDKKYKSQKLTIPYDEDGYRAYVEDPTKTYTTSYAQRKAMYKYNQKIKKENPEIWAQRVQKRNEASLLKNLKNMNKLKIVDIKLKEKQEYIDVLEEELKKYEDENHDLKLKNKELNKLVQKFKKFI